MRYDYLIVGAGMTADAAVRGIRKHDAKGSIAVVGAEADPPYNRPPLTKALWKGDPLDSIWRRTPEAGAEMHLGRRVDRLDPGGHRVTDTGGVTYEYGKLLLATGGTPRQLADAPEGIIYYRTLPHYRTARVLSSQKARFVVIGGGFIGAEIAAALRMQGREVAMVVPEAGIGARVFPADLAEYIAGYYREKGVNVLTRQRVERVSRSGREWAVHTGDGGGITGDAVIAGLGIEPGTALAQSAGATVNNGIVVDEFCRTTLPDVFAAGDVANFYNPALDKRMRVEHEDNANTMGDVAGRNMAGELVPYTHLPFFYSDLFDLGYEAVGEVDSRHETVADWKEPFREGVVYYLESGRVRGVLLWNTWGQVDHARALIAEQGPLDRASLKGRLPK